MQLVRRLGREAQERKVIFATAESCTGGAVAAAITSIPGSSKHFDCAFVTYSNEAKRGMLGVKQASLKKHGAVSEVVAREMAMGALKKSRAHVTVAITGIAGPTGAAPGKPVGTVWFAWAARRGPVQSRVFRFKGARAAVRRQSVVIALRGLIDLLK
jgi:nicotinamide-nucleotide amidase